VQLVAAPAHNIPPALSDTLPLLPLLPLSHTLSHPSVPTHSVSGKGSKRKYDWAEASVNGVPVLKANVFVGKSVAHGIGSVLTPDGPAKVQITVLVTSRCFHRWAVLSWR
jgi:hypothetical protein